MKIFLPILIMVALMNGVQALTLTEIQVAYQAQTLKIDEKRKASLDTLQGGYLKALDKIQKTFQNSGNLKSALMVKDEVEAVKKGTWPLPALPEAIERNVGNSRKLYLKSYVKIDLAWAQSTTKASDKMLALLKEKKLALTKAGDLEEAKKAQMLQEVIEKDPEIARARELPRRVSVGGQSKAAMILRRGGDNIEVLVKYDSSGKVSFESPVENVIESTDGKKEKGETKAKNLGEFVGAKGYTVDSYKSFDETVDSGKLEFTEMIGSTAKKTTSVKDGPAVELKIGKKVGNAYYRLADVLSPKSVSATHRITCEYYVPKDNLKVVGLNFQHGGATGKPIGRPTTAVGKWEAATFEAASGSEDTFLTGYFRGPSFKEFPTIGGDRIYFKSFKIEHVKFSAFVVEKYDANGGLSKKELESEIQEMFIKNGSMVPN